MGLFLSRLFLPKSQKRIEQLNIDDLNCIARYLAVDDIVNLSIASPYVGSCIKHTFISVHCKPEIPNKFKSFNNLYAKSLYTPFSKYGLDGQISRNIKYYEQFDVRLICNLFEPGKLYNYVSEYKNTEPSRLIDQILVAIHKRALSLGYLTSALCYMHKIRLGPIRRSYPNVEFCTGTWTWHKEFKKHQSRELVNIVYGKIPRLNTFLQVGLNCFS